jgi:hypothetical protein
VLEGNLTARRFYDSLGGLEAAFRSWPAEPHPNCGTGGRSSIGCPPFETNMRQTLERIKAATEARGGAEV